MTPAQLNMLIQLSLIVHEIAPPDMQRRIDQLLNAMQMEALPQPKDQPHD